MSSIHKDSFVSISNFELLSDNTLEDLYTYNSFSVSESCQSCGDTESETVKECGTCGMFLCDGCFRSDFDSLCYDCLS